MRSHQPLSRPPFQKLRILSLLAGLPALATSTLSGCDDGQAGNDDVQQVAGDVGALGGTPDTASTIAFDTFTDDVGQRASAETRTLIRNTRGYQSFFGHAPPASVDFSREWVMFYATGAKPTGGYEASFLTVLRSGSRLIAVTHLTSPGSSCIVTQAITTPYVLIKFPAQPGASAQFYRSDSVTDCVANLCAKVTCPTGNACDPATGQCLPSATPVRCGGITGAGCPGQGRCADDPSDSCDPKAGGADCGGICQCVQSQACTKDAKFDSSPSVCACVPSKPVCGPVCDIYCEYGNVLDANGCPTCTCNPPPTDLCATVKCAAGTHCDSGKCVADPVTCGGFAGIACPGQGQCADDPSDSCDPKAGGADCGGICKCVQSQACTKDAKFDGSPSVCACVPSKPVCGPVCDIYCEYGNVLDANGCPTCRCNPAPADLCATVKCAAGTHCDSGKCVADKVSCGGIAGKACPGGGKCVDDPSDSCDPAHGGADCGGICSCLETALCVSTHKFDSSPSVCACVPITPSPCPNEKCPAPAPASPTMICSDGSTAGPTCAPNASGICAWAVTKCPTP